MLRYWAAALLACLLWATSTWAEDIAVPVDWNGQQIQIRARFYKPAGPGPFPLVIMLHHCGGLSSYWGNNLGTYEGLIGGQGYAILEPDSFTARGVENDCRMGQVKARDRAQDVFAAAEIMAGRPDIKAGRIGVIGWSHGAGAAVYVARDWPDERPWREKLAAQGGKIAASVALYGGGCSNPERASVVTPLLQLLGGMDSVTQPATCEALANSQANGIMQVHVYPDAFHMFDSPMAGSGSNVDVDRPRSLPGAARGLLFAYNPAAAQDAHARILALFHQYLQ
jgi:dienelactone hydrolase